MSKLRYCIRLTHTYSGTTRVEWVSSPGTERVTQASRRAVHESLDDVQAIARFWRQWEPRAQVDVMIDPVTSVPTETFS